MRLCIVPMKPLAAAKARLAAVLGPDERRALSLAMLTDVVRAARAVDAVWVLQSDTEAAQVALSLGAEAHPDPAPGAGLNASFEEATRAAIGAGASGVLLLSADCPAVTATDVRAIARGRGVAIAPDAAGAGTNALWRSPPAAIALAFGPGSREAHEAAARAGGVPLRIVRRPGLALDVDRPEDLEEAARAGGAATKALLISLGYPAAGRR